MSYYYDGAAADGAGSRSSERRDSQQRSASALSFTREREELTSQPSFMTSAATLPGALGISDAPWQQRRGSEGRGSAASPAPSLVLAGGGRSVTPSRYGDDKEQLSRTSFQARSGSAASLPYDSASDGRPGSAHSAPRTFLVPVGSTGARQKLNILSASKRPWPSGAAAPPDQSGGEGRGASAADRLGMRTSSSSLPRPAAALDSLGHGSPPRFGAVGNGKAPGSRVSSGEAQAGPSSRPSTAGAGANGSPKQPLRKTSEDSMAALASGLNAARDSFQPPSSLPLSRSASGSTSDDEARHVALRSKSRDELRSTSSGSAKGFAGGALPLRSTSRPEQGGDLTNGSEQRSQSVERNDVAGRTDVSRPSTAPRVAAGDSLPRSSQARPSTASSIGRASMRNLKSMFSGKREQSDTSPPMGSAPTSGSPDVSGRASASEQATSGRPSTAGSSPQQGMRGQSHRTMPSRSMSSEHSASVDFGLGNSGLFIEGADTAQSQSTSSVNSSLASRSGTTASSFLPDAPDLGLGFDDLSTMFSQYKTSSPTPLEVQAKQGLPVLELEDGDQAAAPATLRVPMPAANAQQGLVVDDKSLPPTPHTPSPAPSPAPAPEKPPVREAATSSGWSPEVSKESRTSERKARDSPTQANSTGTDSPRSSQSFAASLLPLRRGAAEQASARSKASGLSSAHRGAPAPSPTPVSSRGYLPRPGPVSSSFQSPLLATLQDPSAVKAPAAFTPTHQRQASAPTATAWKAEADESETPRLNAPKQDAPKKQRERPATLQADAATLMRLEGLTAPPASSAPAEDAIPAAVTAAAAPSPAVPSIDAATFVPAGALTHTRRGVRVKAGPSGQDAAVSRRGEDATPRGSTENGRKNGRGAASSAMHESRGARQGDGQIISFNSNDFDIGEQRSSLDEAVSMLPAQAWAEVNTALKRFKEGASLDKGALLRSVLLPFLALEAETPVVEVEGGGPFANGKARRTLFFEWIRLLLLDLQHVQTSADRGAILESIACIIESRNFSAPVLTSDPEDEARFSSVFGHILSYAIGELNKKGVYQNTLIFSGRLLAVAFFRVDGVASKLLRALPVNRFALERVATEAGWDAAQPADWDDYCMRFPVSLQPFCYRDARSYLKILDSQTLAGTGEDENEEDRFLVRQPEVEVEMTGNWLRRWQSDDSELFFSFCRSFHRQLASLMSARETFDAAASRAFFGAPGYAHLATCIHQKCLSLVHRDILSVTTLSSQKNFNPGETANVLSGSTAGKPRHLEAANRRCTAIVVDIVRAPSTSNHMFGPMLGAHVKCLLKRTSLYDVQGVFCVMDWLDGVLNHIDTAELHAESLIDIDFIIETVGLLLREADHALALMRTVAFCYSNFGVLTSTKRNRTRFCEDILLNPAVFEKLFLSWSFTIRAYFLHLLVFRLARINDFPNPADDAKGKTNVSIAHLFNQRLDDIRRRHDELSPSSGATDSGSETEEQKQGDGSGKSRPRPLSFVSTIRHTPSVHRPETTKAERVLGIGLPDPVLTSKAEIKTQSRAAKWLRALGAKSSTGRTKGKNEPLSAGSDGASGSPQGLIESPTIKNEPRARMPRLDELDSDSDDDDDDAGSNASSPWEKSTISSFGGGDTPRAEDGPSPGSEFSFEGRIGPDSTDAVQPTNGDHLAPDVSFDLQSPTSQLPPASHALMPNGRSSPRLGTASPRVSRAFSKRSSFLPGPAFDLVNQDEEAPPVPSVPTHLRRSYDKTLHVYAVQSLREYEQTVQEHDDYFSNAQLDGSIPTVPRLPINWPAMWASE